MLRQIILESWHTIKERWWLLVVSVLVAAVAGGPDKGIVGTVYGFREIRRVLADSGLAGVVNNGQGLPPIEPATHQPSLFALGVGLLVALLCGALLALIVVGVVVRLAQGVIIAGAGVDEGFGAAMRLAWQRLWRLIIIISIPPIPITVGAILSVMLVSGLLLTSGLRGDIEGIVAYVRYARWLHTSLIALNTPFALATLALAVLQIPADRACVLEDQKAVAAFKTGWHGIRKKLAMFVPVLVGQLALGVGVAWGLRYLRDFAGVDILLRPLTWGVNGVLLAFFSVMWTRAWILWNPASTASE